MIRLLISIIFASVISIGLINVFKNLFGKLGTKTMTIFSIVIEALIGIGVSVIATAFLDKLVFTKIVYALITSIGTIGLTQVSYDYVAKLIDAIKTKLNK